MKFDACWFDEGFVDEIKKGKWNLMLVSSRKALSMKYRNENR